MSKNRKSQALPFRAIVPPANKQLPAQRLRMDDGCELAAWIEETPDERFRVRFQTTYPGEPELNEAWFTTSNTLADAQKSYDEGWQSFLECLALAYDRFGVQGAGTLENVTVVKES
jgi:hypothetical protein